MPKYFLACLILLFSHFSHSQSRLSTREDIIVDERGNEVQLRGVNLGSWFLIEPYMISENQAQAQWQIKRKMITRGARVDEVEQFFAAWRDLFIKQVDIDHIASLGLNSIRFPLHYELFLTPHQREVRDRIISDSSTADAFIDSMVSWQRAGLLFTDASVEGYQRIDTMIAWCRPHGIYITLDLHAAPGGQGNQLAINDGISKNQFWRGKHAREFQSMTLLFWKKVSERYKAEHLIAMYDLLNEPNHVIYIPRLRRFYRRMLTIIRNNNDQHLVLLEGGLWGSTYMMMRPEFYRRRHFTNLVYNLHDYSGWRQPKNKQQAVRLRMRQNIVPFILTEELTARRFQKKNHIPIYVSEFGEMGADWVGKKILTYDSLRLSWSFWAYKKIAYDGTRCASGVSCIGTVDLYSREGREKCLEALRQRKIILSEEYINAMHGKPLLK
jgi:hypothetical protein